MNGAEEMKRLTDAGYSPQDVDAWRAQKSQALIDGGFSQQDVGEYFGEKEPNNDKLNGFFKLNIDAAKQQPGEARQAKTFGDYLDAGYQQSITGLLKRHKMPDVMTPEDAPMWAKIASSVSQVAGDLPAMISGAWAGGEVGTAAGTPVGAAIGTAIEPGLGTLAGAGVGARGGALIGGGAGAFALPAYMRRILVDQYQHGEAKNFGDFWSRQAAAFIDAYQAAEIGAATAGTGAVVGKAIAQPIVSTTAKLASEITTMVTLGKAAEGKVPELKDFAAPAVVVAGLHIATGGAGQVSRLMQKAGDVYAKTGTLPADLAREAEANPVVRQELASTNIDVPAAYADKIEADQQTEPTPVNVSEKMRAPLEIGGKAGDVALREEVDSSDARPQSESPEPRETASGGQAPIGWSEATRIRSKSTSQPLTVYRGGTREVGAGHFDEQVLGDKTGHPSSGLGVFFTTSEEEAAQYGHTRPANLDIRNPKVIPVETLPAFDSTAEAAKFRKELQAKGYDGIIIKNSHIGGHNWIVAFNADQVIKVPEKPAVESQNFAVTPVTSESTTVEKASEPPVEKTAVEQIQSRISFEKNPTGGFSLSKFYTSAVDALHPVRQLRDLLAGEQPLEAKDDPYLLARLTRGSYGRADQFLELSPFKFDTLENVGKSLSAVLKPVRDKIDEFRAYAVARRAIELSERGIEPGVPVDAAREVVKAGGKYSSVFKELQDYQRATLEYLRDSGVLGRDAFEAMRDANQDYVPFYRLMDTDKSLSAGKGLSVRSPVKTIKGSERMIVDPIESIVKNTYLYVQLAERNRALTSLADLAEQSPLGQELMERVPAEMRPTTVSEAEVAKFLKEQGIEGDAEAFAIFRPASKNLANDEIALYRDGKREVYRVAPEVATSVRALDQESVSLLVKMAALPAQLLRAGTTLSPDFVARNFLRDQITAFTLNKGGFIPVYDTLRGMGSIFKKDDDYQNWLKSGAANSVMVSVDRQYIQQNVLKLAKETGLMSQAWNVVKSPIELLKVGSELIENATRLGAFKRELGDSTDASDIFQAGYGARNVTLDFQRIGAKTRAMNMITAFWNASVQGLDKTARAFAERPFETSFKLSASITAPSMLLWYANHDDPRWKEIPNWQKDLFWIVMTQDHVYRIPKPMELGILFGSLPERVLDKFYDDKPDAFKGISSDFAGALAPSFLPTFAIPVIEQFANRSTFTGSPIVPHSLEGVLPEYQYSDYTTESGKILGKFAAVVPGMKDSQLSSPMVIENYARAWSGTLGMYALKMADQALISSGAIPDPVKPASALADMPIIKAFMIRYPSASAQSIQDFYERYDEAKKRMDTIHHLARQGDFAASIKEMNLAQESDLMLNLGGIKDAIAAQTRFIQLVYKNQQMTPDEKRQIIDGSYYMMIKMTEQGNALLMKAKETLH